MLIELCNSPDMKHWIWCNLKCIVNSNVTVHVNFP